MVGHDTAEDSACDTAKRPCDTVGPRIRASSAHARAWPLGVSVIIQRLYHDLGRHLCRNRGNDTGFDTSQDALRYGAMRARQRTRVAIQNCIVTEGKGSRAATLRASAPVRAATRPRYCRVLHCVATRSGSATTQRQCARSVRAGWAKGGCNMHSTQF